MQVNKDHFTYRADLLKGSLDVLTAQEVAYVQEFNALALVPIPEEGRSFRPVREDRSIEHK